MNMFEEHYHRRVFEKIYPTYGLHRMCETNQRTITGVSAYSWETYWQLLNQVKDSDGIVVGPELITSAGMKMYEIADNRAEIEKRVDQVKQLSKDFSKAVVVLGSATFELTKPNNSLLIIQNGEEITRTDKRSGATNEERGIFIFKANEKPCTIPGTDIDLLICSDLAIYSAFLRSKKTETILTNEVWRLSGRNELIGKKLTFARENCKEIIVSSCWGIGGNRLLSEDSPQEYYLNQLRSISAGVMSDSNVKRIIMIDRAPSGFNDSDSFVTKNPLNIVIEKR
jgi:predicted amidohydrolase